MLSYVLVPYQDTSRVHVEVKDQGSQEERTGVTWSHCQREVKGIRGVTGPQEEDEETSGDNKVRVKHEVTEGSEGYQGTLEGSDQTSKALMRHIGLMRRYHKTEGIPEGGHVTRLYWAAELRRGRMAPSSSQQLHCQFLQKKHHVSRGSLRRTSLGTSGMKKESIFAHHDSIDNITMVVLQGPHSLCPGHIGLGHHQFNVTRF